MNTRQAEPGEPISFNKYMSSPEYAELRGIDGRAATKKAALLTDARKRSLLFFVQAMSLRPGGLKQFAADLVAAFPERLGTPVMHSFGIRPGQIYSNPEARAIFSELNLWSAQELLDGTDNRPIAKQERTVERFLAECRGRQDEMQRLLIELCVNPRCEIRLPGESAKDLGERQRIQECYPELHDYEFKGASLTWFHDVMGGLLEYQRRFADSAGAALAQTGVAAIVTKTLDRALRHRKMVVIEGEPGIGKSKAAAVWAEQHLGEARLVSLSGCVNKTGIFRTIGRALGLASCFQSRGVTEIQVRIEDALQRSGLALVIDEGHFLFAQGERIHSRPEMIDWIDTALCNASVPVAIVATPQLTRRLHQVERQTIWQSTQFRRRIKDYVLLPKGASDEDLAAVAHKVLPECNRASIKLIVGHARVAQSGWPLTWIVNLAEDARVVAQEAGRAEVTFSDIEAAINTTATF